MMEKKVSVIIPFYNGLDWLCEAIQSVLDQTYKNFEIIVVNDGSPEEIMPFLDRYGDKIIYRYKENGGPASARNLAISIATGDYIAFLDSDDIWLPTKTKKQIAFMDKTGAMWSHTNYYNWYPTNNKKKVVLSHFDFDNVYIKSYISISIATPSVIINRVIFNEISNLLFPTNLRLGEDTKFWRRISKDYSLALINEPLVKVRMRGNNSFKNAVSRFNLKSQEYVIIKNSEERIPKMILFIYSIYYLYSKVFGEKTNKSKEFIAKCFWILPFFIERVYQKYIIATYPKDKKYLLGHNPK